MSDFLVYHRALHDIIPPSRRLITAVENENYDYDGLRGEAEGRNLDGPSAPPLSDAHASILRTCAYGGVDGRKQSETGQN